MNQAFNHLHPDASKSSNIWPNLIFISFLILCTFVLFGCVGIKTQVKFEKLGPEGASISGTVAAKLSKVQEFRSLLESLEYRVGEKAK